MTVTKTVPTSTSACPPWCNNGDSCDGQHNQAPLCYIAATGSDPKPSDSGMGVTLPSLGIGARWPESFGGGRKVVVHDPETDAEYVFELYEAFRLLQELLDAYVMSSEGVNHPAAGFGGAEDFFRSVETLRASIYRKAVLA